MANKIWFSFSSSFSFLLTDQAPRLKITTLKGILINVTSLPLLFCVALTRILHKTFSKHRYGEKPK